MKFARNMFVGGGRSAIGLDVGPRWVSAVQLARGGGGAAGWRLEAAVRIARAVGSAGGAAPSKEEFERVWEVLDRQGFVGKQVVIAAPETAVFSATLELPPRSSGAPVEELACQELARSVKREAGEIEVAMWDVPRSSRGGGADGLNVMAVGLAHADAEPLLEAVEEGAAVVVEAIECRCTAMARACAGLVDGTGGAGVTALVDVGDAAASIVVVHGGTGASVMGGGGGGGVVVYDRVVRDAGLDRLRQMVRDGLGGGGGADSEGVDLIMDAVAGGGSGSGRMELPAHTESMVTAVVDEYVAQLVQELRTVLAYAIHRYPGSIGPVLLMGTGAEIAELGARIGKELDLASRVVRLGDVIGGGVGGGVGATDGRAERGGDAGLTVAAGLALRPRPAVMRRAA